MRFPYVRRAQALALALIVAGSSAACGQILGLSAFQNECGGDLDAPCTPGGGGGGASSSSSGSGVTTTSQSSTSTGSITCHRAADCPASGTVCATPTCDGTGHCTNTPADARLPCTDGEGSLCDGDGSCVACLSSTDCASATTCVKVTCDASHSCVTSNANLGDGCSDGDGHVCDGFGACVACNTPADCPASGSDCVSGASCDGNACTPVTAHEGATCADNGGHYCDADGRCIAAAVPATGDYHSCAITTVGGAKCWGSGADLGDGSGMDSATPVDVLDVANLIGLGTGYQHSCALSQGGTVQCWGSNYAGQLGTGDNVVHPTPTAVPGLSGVTSIVVRDSDTCAVDSAGDVLCWGENHGGKFGAGVPGGVMSPTVITDLTSVSAVAVGGDQLCVLLGSVGVVECITGGMAPEGVNGLDRVVALSAGNSFACALEQNGSVHCWGSNNNGELGDGAVIGGYSVDATQVVGLNAVAVSAGQGHACAISTTGGVLCWGYNADGELGDGTSTRSNVPVQVSGLTSGVVAIAAGLDQTCAVLDDGHMKCWGAAIALGDGSGVDHHTPVEVQGL